MILTRQYNKTITLSEIKNILQKLISEHSENPYQSVHTDHFFYPSVVNELPTSLFFSWDKGWYLETHK